MLQAMRRSSRVQARVEASADEPPSREASPSPERKPAIRAKAAPQHPRKAALKKPKQTKQVADDGSEDSDVDILRQLKDTRPIKKRVTKRKEASSGIKLLDSLDALLAADSAEVEKKKGHTRKLQKIMQERDEMKEHEPAETEQFGYVFEPMTEPIPLPRFQSVKTDDADLALLYDAIAKVADDVEELGSLLHSKILLLYLHEKCGLVEAPVPITAYLFALVGGHPNDHIVRGAFLNLFLLLTPATGDVVQFTSGLPSALLALHAPLPIGMAAKCLELNHFLATFRLYGFHETKRGLSNVQRASTRETATADAALPFPSLNMEYTVMVFILALRTESIKLPDYDTFCAVVFFLRLQFETTIRPQLLELTSYALEALLDQFTPREWRRDYARKLIMKIASGSEGFFKSAAGWLTIARRLPRTDRGTQLTTGLAVYVLQHRIDQESAANEEPLEFPVGYHIVIDIVASLVDSLTQTYANNNVHVTAPPYEMICTKIGLMDLALQAYLNDAKTQDISLLLSKLDLLADANKAMQCEEWHQLKTLVSLMHRKYAPEHLRVGRSEPPKAKKPLVFDE
ncbi:hypothetical protein SPRG_05037 [Saprolegnia parasitica CBS 223.65]|uniref:Coiled-coil SMC6 And NSE5 INteracting (CANIN) domain-containing protein n=1 Tax=Saprolegnia parasitica (strain CBS 223.65) TaxID=695850 RepID=A0A067CUX7_SAPPC|nr:hypothetical protein SPRG_05037 [Saprolegnia parasitica CBS 223.65]KDO30326.1 hypothetical protein SPRG_05037 [Saprolegnia parasitica CBS 223.65]|eukprot:XP_012198936.1 hypothetical protein SPRG_05037 [Saprolegnia parasitica CBS 223.65]